MLKTPTTPANLHHTTTTKMAFAFLSLMHLLEQPQPPDHHHNTTTSSADPGTLKLVTTLGPGSGVALDENILIFSLVDTEMFQDLVMALMNLTCPVSKYQKTVHNFLVHQEVSLPEVTWGKRNVRLILIFEIIARISLDENEFLSIEYLYESALYLLLNSPAVSTNE
eukprot:GFUD01140231.1.p1 GENE.GFUD01140231.1~~GFUD01140231.1.p1  ORF type:complete len:167 (-),score=34.08 GFUD01140231.1:22-522(-)